jgi:hypothetical protein
MSPNVPRIKEVAEGNLGEAFYPPLYNPKGKVAKQPQSPALFLSQFLLNATFIFRYCHFQFKPKHITIKRNCFLDVLNREIWRNFFSIFYPSIFYNLKDWLI